MIYVGRMSLRKQGSEMWRLLFDEIIKRQMQLDIV